jgi:cell division protein FtsL
MMKNLSFEKKLFYIIAIVLLVSFILVFAEYKTMDSRMRAGHSDSTVVLKKQ